MNALVKLMDQLSTNTSSSNKPKSRNGHQTKNNKFSPSKNNGENHNGKGLKQGPTKPDSTRESPPPRKRVQPKV